MAERLKTASAICVSIDGFSDVLSRSVACWISYHFSSDEFSSSEREYAVNLNSKLSHGYYFILIYYALLTCVWPCHRLPNSHD